MTPGPRNLITDIAGLRVGNAEDATLKSGTTVLVGAAPFVASVAVMGGAPGTRETDLLEPDKMAPAVDALVLSGGSAFGLAAAQGVMDALAEQGRGFAVGPARVPIVPAAILFDLLNGGDKAWAANPYPALGRSALANAAVDFALGTAGAGTGATTAMLKGGPGAARSPSGRWSPPTRWAASPPPAQVISGLRLSNWAANSAVWAPIPRRNTSTWRRAASSRRWRRAPIPPSPWSPPTPGLPRRRPGAWRWRRMTASRGRWCRPIRRWTAT